MLYILYFEGLSLSRALEEPPVLVGVRKIVWSRAPDPIWLGNDALARGDESKKARLHEGSEPWAMHENRSMSLSWFSMTRETIKLTMKRLCHWPPAKELAFVEACSRMKPRRDKTAPSKKTER